MEKIYDIVGIGFGPTNLSLCTFYESELKPSGDELEMVFFEQKDHFDWHPGMLIPGADMQISFLKDLITLVNPASKYTFLNFLKQTDGLEKFINLRTFYPSRHEFRNYLRWAADKLQKYVKYNRSVTRISHKLVNGEQLIQVASQNSDGSDAGTVLARNIVVSTGGSPKLPSFASQLKSPRIVHSGAFIESLQENFPDHQAAYRMLVVGGGQSSAEMYKHLYETYPNARVSLCIKGIGFKPSDDSEFVNQLFDASFVDEFYASPDEFRTEFLAKHKDTNYGVVDPDLISDIFAKFYEESRSDSSRLEYRRFTEMVSLTEDEEGALVAGLRNLTSSDTTESSWDGVFFATGYDFTKGVALLDEIRDKLLFDASGMPKMQRDYSVQSKAEFAPKVFVFGPTEQTHGLTSVLLSILPHRAEDLFNSINAPREGLVYSHG